AFIPFFFSSRRRHTRFSRDWSSDVCSSDLQRWMMMYLDLARYAVVLRTSPELTGPWSAPVVVVDGQDQPGLYAPYIVPLEGPGRSEERRVGKERKTRVVESDKDGKEIV